MEDKNCGNCKNYKKENDFVGECFTILMSVIITNPIEHPEYESANKLMVRKEFACMHHKYE